MLIVDPVALGRCPQDRVGEIWVRSPAVTGEYWDSPAASTATFGARLDGGSTGYLRTGDLAFEHDGEIFITGRIKDLIVIRGRNHYPHDIEETAGSAHPLALPGRAAAFSADIQGEERLILVQEVGPGCRAAEAATVESALREAIAAEHGIRPHELVLVRRGGVPRTTSGKIRRDECRRRWLTGSLRRIGPSGRGSTAGPADTSRTPEVAALTALAAEALETDSVPADIPLVALGLDSVRAVRLTAWHRPLLRCRGADGVHLAGRQRRRTGGDRHHARSRGRRSPRGDAPAGTDASSAQTSMWLLDQLGAGAAYHIAGGLRLRGRLDPSRLHDCLNQLTGDYVALRETFTMADDGVLRRMTRPPAPVELPLLDLAASPDAAARSEDEIARLGAAPFDLATGPLIRFVLIRLDDQDWRLGVALHHIIADGWSLAILLGRLGELYPDGGTEARGLARGRQVPSAQPGRTCRATGGPAASRPRTLAVRGLQRCWPTTAPYAAVAGEAAASRRNSARTCAPGSVSTPRPSVSPRSWCCSQLWRRSWPAGPASTTW